jgi:DNA-binding transcriptional LysR family regulator
MNTGIGLRQLRYFVCLADELHFGRAAERLGIAQAPLSQKIKQMEERLGVVLFHRTTRRTRLTSAGETLLHHARDILDWMDRAQAHWRAMAGEITGRIAVAGISVTQSQVLPPILTEFRRQRPAVIVDVVPLGTGEQLKTLEAGGINIAFIRPTEQAAIMQMETLMREGFVAALPIGHPPAARPELTLRDFAGEWLIGYAPILGASYSLTVTAALQRVGQSGRVVQQCTHTVSVAARIAGSTTWAKGSRP